MSQTNRGDAVGLWTRFLWRGKFLVNAEGNGRKDSLAEVFLGAVLLVAATDAGRQQEETGEL